MAVDELENTAGGIKAAGMRKDIKPYANAFMSHLLDMEQKHGIVPTVFAGRSKGGRVSTILASHADMPPLEHVVTADMPGAHRYLSKLHFGALVLLFENLEKYKGPTLVGIDDAEEASLTELDIPTAEPPSALDLLKRVPGELWIIRGLGATGLRTEFEGAMGAQIKAKFTNFHATGNLGMPLEANNAILADLAEQYPGRLDAYIGHTRHFAEGHGPRFGRQLALSLDSDNLT